ncbi:hypothetical protein BDV18DRAFT_144536 [Aspergillus unguis]
MPPRRAVSPLHLETCETLESGIDDCSLPGSDDELTESQIAAQHRRIEKLGGTYLKGAPLFILSASLRGPLDQGWVNPWKKDRRKGASKGHKRPTEQPIIPETNSRKRRQYHSPSVVSGSRSPGTLQAPTRKNPACDDAHKKSSFAGRTRGSETAASSQSPRFIRHQHTDTGWLKKDRGSGRFRNIDPPTSPTTSISSRHIKRAVAPSSQSSNRTGTAGYESARSSKSQQGIARQAELVPEPESGPNSPVYDQERHTPGLALQDGSSQLPTGAESIHVVSSSSQLPKFEYRLKQHGKSALVPKPRRSLDPKENESSATSMIGVRDLLAVGPEDSPHEPPSAPAAKTDNDESNDQQNMERSLASTDRSNAPENALSTGTCSRLDRSTENDITSENNLPSAQQAPGNRPPDNATSLYSIAVSKATSNRTEDHNADQNFSTQAALMMAQKSFQNDLRSPELSPVTLTRKPHALNHQSPNVINITPFHKMNNPEKDVTNRSGNQQKGGIPMVSTQCMIDAATPFTFSTEKKADFRTLSSEENKSKAKSRKTTSFALSSPSEISSEHLTSDEDEDENIMQGQPAEGQESPSRSQQSALPLTLTGTTPPTAQEGQGAESFDLSQAIAEAGSWLQQSFEINKDITHCKAAKTSQPYPTNSTNSTNSA